MKPCKLCGQEILNTLNKTPRQFVFTKYCPPCREGIRVEYNRIQKQNWVDAVEAVRLKTAAS